MNQTNVRVRYLDLEAANADAETVSALVGIVSQVQSGKVLPVVTAASVETTIDAPLALPAKAPRAYKPRAAKAAPAAAGEASGRKRGGGALVIDAIRSNSRPDKNKLAKAIYGDSSDASLKKLGHQLSYLCRTGKLKSSGDGTYAVNG